MSAPTRRRTARILASWLMPLAYSAAVLLVFWYLWVPFEPLQRTWRFDPVHQYWGDLVFLAQSLGDGELALWNPHDRGGFPVYGDPQPGMLYPPNWLVVALGRVFGGMSYALTEAKIVGHWIFGAIGMHLFLRRRGCPEPACYAGGILLSYSSPAIRYGGSALNWTYAWIPWVLLATDWFCERPGARRAIVLGTAVAMSLLAGAPAVFLYMLLIAIPYGVYSLWGRIRASAGWIAAAAGVSALWLLPLVLGNLEMLPHTVRENRDFAFITTTAFKPEHLINVLVPRLGGENIFYGVLPLGAVAVAMTLRGGGRVLLLTICAAAGALFALGAYIDLLPATASWAPPFTLFRSAHRYLYVTSAAVAAAVGLGLGAVAALEDEQRRRELARRALVVGGGIAVVLAVGLIASVVAGRQGRVEAFAFALVSAVAGTALLCALVSREPRRRPALLWGAALFVAVDLGVANALVQLPGLDAKPQTSRDEVIERLDGVREGEVRIFDREYLRYRPGVRLGIRDFSGYEEDPLALSRYTKFLRRAERDLSLLGHANIRYYLHGEHPWLDLSPPPGAPVERMEKGVYEVEHVAPAVMYVADPARAESIDEALARLSEITAGQGAVVEGEVARGPPDAPVTAGRIVSLEPNRLVAEIETPGAGAVIVSEAYFPAWEAMVDGEPAEILPANVMFRAVSVPGPGRHRIEMALAPGTFTRALPAYGLAWLLLVGALVAGLRRRN